MGILMQLCLFYFLSSIQKYSLSIYFALNIVPNPGDVATDEKDIDLFLT
jgi:hypothetical protein